MIGAGVIKLLCMMMVLAHWTGCIFGLIAYYNNGEQVYELRGCGFDLTFLVE